MNLVTNSEPRDQLSYSTNAPWWANQPAYPTCPALPYLPALPYPTCPTLPDLPYPTLPILQGRRKRVAKSASQLYLPYLPTLPYPTSLNPTYQPAGVRCVWRQVTAKAGRYEDRLRDGPASGGKRLQV